MSRTIVERIRAEKHSRAGIPPDTAGMRLPSSTTGAHAAPPEIAFIEAFLTRFTNEVIPLVSRSVSQEVRQILGPVCSEIRECIQDSLDATSKEIVTLHQNAASVLTDSGPKRVDRDVSPSFVSSESRSFGQETGAIDDLEESFIETSGDLEIPIAELKNELERIMRDPANMEIGLSESRTLSGEQDTMMLESLDDEDKEWLASDGVFAGDFVDTSEHVGQLGDLDQISDLAAIDAKLESDSSEVLDDSDDDDPSAASADAELDADPDEELETELNEGLDEVLDVGLFDEADLDVGAPDDAPFDAARSIDDIDEAIDETIEETIAIEDALAALSDAVEELSADSRSVAAALAATKRDDAAVEPDDAVALEEVDGDGEPTAEVVDDFEATLLDETYARKTPADEVDTASPEPEPAIDEAPVEAVETAAAPDAIVPPTGPQEAPGMEPLAVEAPTETTPAELDEDSTLEYLDRLTEAIREGNNLIADKLEYVELLISANFESLVARVEHALTRK